MIEHTESDPWQGHDPQRVIQIMVSKKLLPTTESIGNKKKSIMYIWSYLPSYRREHCKETFYQQTKRVQEEILAASEKPISESCTTPITPEISYLTHQRRPKSTIDDYARVYHLFQDVRLETLWCLAMTNDASVYVNYSEDDLQGKKHYWGQLLLEFNDYPNNRYVHSFFLLNLITEHKNYILATIQTATKTVSLRARPISAHKAIRRNIMGFHPRISELVER